MIDYIQFKRFLLSFMSPGNKYSENYMDKDLTFEICDKSLVTHRIVFWDHELREYYEKVISTYEYDGITLYNNCYWEVAVDISPIMLPSLHMNNITEDQKNKITYTLGLISIEYCVFLLIQLASIYYENHNEFPYNVLYILSKRFHIVKDELVAAENTDWKDLIICLINKASLSIKSTTINTKAQWDDIKTSYSFNYMYMVHNSIVEYKSLFEMFHLNEPAFNTNSDSSFYFPPPLRKYNSEVVDYYRLALSTNDPYIQYLSFYHILEYYFEEVFRSKLISDLKNKLTHPDFSYNDNDKV